MFRSRSNAPRSAKAAATRIFACDAQVIPSLGLCDGIRIGPDVTPYWLNRALTVWLNNPNETSTLNAIHTCIYRTWLKPLVNIDPDVMYFQSKHNALKPSENQLLHDLGPYQASKRHLI